MIQTEKRVDIGEVLVSQTDTGFKWGIIITGFYLYVLSTTIGFLFDEKYYNYIGFFIFFFLILLAGGYKQSPIKQNRAFVLAVLILAYSFITALLNYETLNGLYFIKHVMVYILYILMLLIGLDPIYSSAHRNYLICLILFTIISAFIIASITGNYNMPGQLGIFVNRNNLSLMTLSLLFFIDEDRDSLSKHITMHTTVLYFLLHSGTLGALLAYLLAVSVKYRKYLLNPKILASLLILFALIIYVPDLQIGPIKKMVAQFNAIRDSIWDILLFNRPNYGDLLGKYGPDGLSGAWRLAHWLSAWTILRDSTVIQILFGNGAGIAIEQMGALPHNEYLRIMIEQGAIGLALILIFFTSIYNSMKREYRYIMLMYGIYCFTENNLDNFLFMSLFMLFIVTDQKTNRDMIVISHAK